MLKKEKKKPICTQFLTNCKWLGSLITKVKKGKCIWKKLTKNCSRRQCCNWLKYCRKGKCKNLHKTCKFSGQTRCTVTKGVCNWRNRTKTIKQKRCCKFKQVCENRFKMF